jgi:ATP/maltotriose-dependent transcriptional regulator MalT
LAREEGNPENLGWARGYLSFLAGLSGELVHAGLGTVRAAGREAVEIAESLGSEYSRAIAYMALGTAHLVEGQWSEARSCCETSLEIARDHRTGLEFKADTLVWLARAQLADGDAAGARRTAEEAVVLAREHGQPHFEAMAQLVLARERCTVGEAGAAEEAEAALDRASALVEESGARGLEPQIAEARAQVMRMLGDDAARERELCEAHRLYVEIGATGHAKRLAQELGL